MMNQEKTNKFIIPAPPSHIFEEAKGSIEKVLSEGQITFVLDHLEYPAEGGILRYLEGAKYPQKGWPFPEVISVLNVWKRLLVVTFQLLSNKMLLPSYLLFVLLPHKRKIKELERVLSPLNDVGFRFLQSYFLKDQFLTPVAREVGSITYDFLAALGVRHDISYRFAKLLETVFEYDDAYRYRLQDIMSETSKKKLLENPRKELKRLFKMYRERETNGYGEESLSMTSKAKAVVLLLDLALLIPKVKKAFNKTISLSSISKLQYDEADRYWCNMRGDYRYFGLLFEEREKEMVQGYTFTI